jgi:hypothetical protein
MPDRADLIVGEVCGFTAAAQLLIAPLVASYEGV